MPSHPSPPHPPSPHSPHVLQARSWVGVEPPIRYASAFILSAAIIHTAYVLVHITCCWRKTIRKANKRVARTLSSGVRSKRRSRTSVEGEGYESDKEDDWRQSGRCGNVPFLGSSVVSLCRCLYYIKGSRSPFYLIYIWCTEVREEGYARHVCGLCAVRAMNGFSGQRASHCFVALPSSFTSSPPLASRPYCSNSYGKLLSSFSLSSSSARRG